MSPRKLVTGLLTAALFASTAIVAAPTAGWAQQPPAAAAPDQQPGPRGPHRERPMPGRHIEGRLAFLRTELKITPSQQPQWERVEAVMRSNATAMRQTAEQMRGRPDQPGQAAGAAERMERMAQLAEQRATQAKAFAAAFRPLYDSLSPEQKKSADELFSRPMRHGGRH